jgi:hypothetical protein
MAELERPPGPIEVQGPGLLLFTFGVVAEILVNLYIIWYFLYGMSAACARRAAETAGHETCGPGTAVPVIVLISAALVLAGMYFLYRWHLKKPA